MAQDKRCPKKSSEDVFGAYLFEGATFTEYYDLPMLPAVHCRPSRMITFSEARNPNRNDPDAAVCFFEHDQVFRPFLKNPGKYVPVLAGRPCIIMPDISTYYDMPYWMKGHGALMNYGYAWWMTRHGATVVPNARVVRTLPPEATLGGIQKNSTIAIGAHGCLKTRSNRRMFIEDVATITEFLHPSNILVFGENSYGAFDYPIGKGVRVDFYPARISKRHWGGAENGK